MVGRLRGRADPVRRSASPPLPLRPGCGRSGSWRDSSGLAISWRPVLVLATAIAAVGAFADSGQRAELPRRQDRGELGHVLFAVVPDQAHVEGREGAGVVVDRSRLEVGVEGRHASRGAGASVDAFGDLEVGGRDLRMGRIRRGVELGLWSCSCRRPAG